MSGQTAEGKVFINYRRSDTGHLAGRLADRLKAVLGDSRVFIDVRDIKPAEDFVKTLERQIPACDLMLSVIGRDWARTEDKDTGALRLHNPQDHLRREIETALDLNLAVLPIMGEGIDMPDADLLPEALHPVTRLNSLPLTVTGFEVEIGRVIVAVEEILAEASRKRAAEIARRAEVAAAVETQQAADELDAAKPRGTLTPEDLAKAEELENWEFVKSRADPALLREHIERYGAGVSTRWAEAKLAEVEWSLLGDAPDAAALERFLAEFSDSTFGQAAEARLDALKAEHEKVAAVDRREAEVAHAWAEAREARQEAGIEAFLKAYPDNPHQTAARNLLAELRRQDFSPPPEAPAGKRILRSMLTAMVAGGVVALIWGFAPNPMSTDSAVAQVAAGLAAAFAIGWRYAPINTLPRLLNGAVLGLVVSLAGWLGRFLVSEISVHGYPIAFFIEDVSKVREQFQVDIAFIPEALVIYAAGDPLMLVSGALGGLLAGSRGRAVRN